MSSEEMSPEESAVRIATVLCTVMNLAALLHDGPALEAIDPLELRSTLMWVVDEMCWMGSVVAGGLTEGISWPADAQERIERLRVMAGTWDPSGPPARELVSAALDCMRILQPGMRAG